MNQQLLRNHAVPRRFRRSISSATVVTATLVAVVAAFLHPTIGSAQSAAITAGSVHGIVTATGTAGQTIYASNVLVQLWTTDAATEAKRDTACAMWTANKSIWMQAKGEAEAPSGINWTGTAVGNDLAVLNSLLALRRDTVRTNANGEYTFASVPFGAYTVEAETYANNKFLQWSMDVPVIPGRTTRIDLDPSTLLENQYCTVVAKPAGAAPDTAKVYTVKDLDNPLRQLAVPATRSDGAGAASPHQTAGQTAIEFVIDPQGVPEPQSVKVTSGNMDIALARTLAQNLRFSPPTVHGVPARVDYTTYITTTVSVTKVQVH